MQLVLQNPLDTDDVVDQDVATVLFREVAAAEDLRPRTGPCSLLINLRRISVFVGVIEIARK